MPRVYHQKKCDRRTPFLQYNKSLHRNSEICWVGNVLHKKILEGKLRRSKEISETQSGKKDPLNNDIHTLECEIGILNSMITYEKDIIHDEEYMSTYYPTALQLYNKGGLTLVSKQFMNWASKLVISINQHINIDNIWQKKNIIMLEAKRIITGDETIYGSFKDALVKNAATNSKVARECHAAIVVKTIHARAGNIFKQFQELFVGHYSKKVNVELRKTLQVQTKSKHQKSVVKVEKHEEEDEHEDEDELTYF